MTADEHLVNSENDGFANAACIATACGAPRNATASHHLLQTAAKASTFEIIASEVPSNSVFCFINSGRSAKVFAKSHAPESGLVDQLEAAFQHEFGHKEDDSGCPDAYLMRKPFKAFGCTVPRPRKWLDTVWSGRKHSGGTSGALRITMLVRAHTWSRP